MHKTQIQFSAGDCITFGEEGEDEVPLTQAPGLQSEVTFQGGRRQALTQQQRHRSRSAVQRLSEGRALSALRRRLRSARTTGAKFWPTLWFAQMSAIVVTLVVAALVALTFVLREAQLTEKEAQNAGRALDIDDIGNGTKHHRCVVRGRRCRLGKQQPSGVECGCGARICRLFHRPVFHARRSPTLERTGS
ncbi:hypothetical protein MTO96_019092 [Rhipicephalus appendiculatus]